VGTAKISAGMVDEISEQRLCISVWSCGGKNRGPDRENVWIKPSTKYREQ
jgi:hypothetical protein